MSPYMRFAPLRDNQSPLTGAFSQNCSDGVQWLWTVMGDCAVTTREQISAYVGLVSMVTWMMVMMPQIIKNFRNIDGMTGVSFLLLFQWSAGDTTNLVGAVLTDQLKPQIYLAGFFVITDVVLLSQYLMFFIRKQRRKRQEHKGVAAASRALLCFMGVASLTHCLMGGLTPTSTLDVHSEVQTVHTGRLSRFLLSEESQNTLRFRSEVQGSFGGLNDLTSSQHSSSFWHNTKDIIGYVIGCISSVFYLGSRTSQIHKNAKDQSTEGLAILTFILAVIGNLAYGGQILIQSLGGEFLLEHTPWIVGSLGVIGLDSTLLWQFYYYGKLNRQQDEARQALIHQEHGGIAGNPSIQNNTSGHSQSNSYSDSLY